MSDARELEVKLLAFSAEQLEALPRRGSLLGLVLESREQGDQEDVYVDTEDYRLLRAGLSLRHRRRAAGEKLTVKEVPGATSRRLLADRREIKEAVEPGRSDPFENSTLVEERVRPLIGARPLRPLVRIRTNRHRFDLMDDGEPVAELCLDAVEVLGDDTSEPVARFFEVEVEDRGAGAEVLESIGQDLRTTHGLQPSDLSKFERGLAVRGLLAEARGEEETFDLALDPGDRLIDAGYKVYRRHFERMKTNEAGTRIGEDPEFLHDCRVSTRRLRAAFRVFRNAFGRTRLASFNDGFRWIARVLGDVRDLDVYIDNLPGYAVDLPEDERVALEPYREHLVRQRIAARRRMLRALDSRRYERFVERFDGFLRRGPARNPRLAPASMPTAEAAPRKIRKSLKLVLARGRAIPRRHPPAPELHDLRMLCKRLRYTCEFFRELYGKGMRRFIRSVVELQDLLGEHQDACVAGDTLRARAAKLPSGRRENLKMALVLGQLIAAQDRAAAESRAGFREAWQAFDQKDTRRRMWSNGGGGSS